MIEVEGGVEVVGVIVALTISLESSKVCISSAHVTIRAVDFGGSTGGRAPGWLSLSTSVIREAPPGKAISSFQPLEGERGG